jgi:hypothetical protein
MGHYDSCRVAESARIAEKHITEEHKVKLLKYLLKMGGEVSLHTEVDNWEWPIVYAMIRSKDTRILYDPQGGGYKIATVKENLSVREKTKLLLK